MQQGTGMTPLHLATEPDVVAALLRVNPLGASVRDAAGQLPIHHVKRKDVATVLLAAHPDGARVKDEDEQLPLHVALAKQRPLDVVIDGRHFEQQWWHTLCGRG